MKNKIIQLTLGLSIMLLTIGFTFADNNTIPIIKTENTPTTTSVYISFPEMYSGKVFTSCINGVCNSTTSPTTEKEIKDLQTRIQEEEKRTEEFFRQQEQFFNQIFKDFNIFGNFNNPGSGSRTEKNYKWSV